MFFFFKQKTAYEMRISDWSSDVCSSDLAGTLAPHRADDIAGLSRRGVGAFHEGEVAIFRRAAERREVPPISVGNRHRRHAVRRRPGPRCAAGRATPSGFLKA